MSARCRASGTTPAWRPELPDISSGRCAAGKLRLPNDPFPSRTRTPGRQSAVWCARQTVGCGSFQPPPPARTCPIAGVTPHRSVLRHSPTRTHTRSHQRTDKGRPDPGNAPGLSHQTTHPGHNVDTRWPE